MEAAKKIGFSTKAVRGNIEKLDNSMLPCIAHVVIDKSYQHFVVIYKIDRKNNVLIVADPAKGIVRIKLNDFNDIATNQFILFIPNKPIPKFEKNKSVLKYIMNFLISHKVLFLSIILFSFIYTVANIVTSYHFQFIIEDVLSINSKNNLYFISLFMLIISLIKVQMDFFRSKLLNIINHKLDYTLIKNIFDYIISLPYIYYKNRTTGEIISRVTDVGEVKEAFSQIIITIFVDIVLVVFVLINLWMISIKLTSILIIMTIIYIFLIIIFNTILNKKIIDSQKQSSKINSFMFESISSVDTIKNNLLENDIKNKFDIQYSKLLNNTYRLNDVYYIQQLLKDIVYYIGMGLILFLGSEFVLKNDLSLVQLITYNSLIVYYLEPIKNIFNIDITLKKVKNSIIRVSELFEIETEKLHLDNKYIGNNVKGNITIKKLSYSYNTRKNILNNLSINIKEGEKVLIYGKSGTGKSTLAKILMGYLKINNGLIKIDNKDINDYNMLELRNNVCYISQCESLFTDSIYNNIVLDKVIDYNSFLDVCKITKVDEIVKDNLLAYDMLLEENGFNISGGERQRIVLARAIIKNSSIYIFDESLSQIDIKKEREILLNIFKKLKNKTIIVISHRFNNQDLFDFKINITKKKAYD